MGVSRSGRPRSGREASEPAAAPAAVVEFAIEQVLRNDTLDALPAVLARLVTAFSGRCALAFQPRTGQPPVVLAAHPDSAAADEVLLSRVGALNPAPGGAADSGSLLVPLKSGGPGTSALLAYSAPAVSACARSPSWATPWTGTPKPCPS